jgi:phosphoribosyl 1,2-cyclic phosphate phosphodiesterase
MKGSPHFEVTFLGTGTSHGVPMIGCDCEVCRSEDPRDKRLRTAIFVRTPETDLIVDTPPDFRSQCLRAGISRADAVVYTHSHTDHTSGFDDLRRFCEVNGGSFPVYASPEVMDDLRVRFAFAFGSTNHPPNYMNPVPRVFTGPFEIGDIQITPVALPHGRCDTSGFVFAWQGEKRLAYFTDCSAVPDAAVAAAAGSKVLVLDTLRWRPHPTHLSVDQAIAIAQSMNIPQTLLTHLSHELGHAATEAVLPPEIKLAYDGLQMHL